MPAFLSVTLAFVIGFLLRSRGWKWWSAWLLSSTIVPTFVLFVEFATEYRGGGASMWPIALAFGGLIGICVGGAGVLAATIFYNAKAREE